MSKLTVEDISEGDIIKTSKSGTNTYRVTRVGEFLLWAVNQATEKETPFIISGLYKLQ